MRVCCPFAVLSCIENESWCVLFLMEKLDAPMLDTGNGMENNALKFCIGGLVLCPYLFFKFFTCAFGEFDAGNNTIGFLEQEENLVLQLPVLWEFLEDLCMD